MNLSFDSVENIERFTGCLRPCVYNTYRVVDDVDNHPSWYGVRPNMTYFEFILPEKNVKIREEVLLYTLQSLIADYGGTLGLFCGFSNGLLCYHNKTVDKAQIKFC